MYPRLLVEPLTQTSNLTGQNGNSIWMSKKHFKLMSGTESLIFLLKLLCSNPSQLTATLPSDAQSLNLEVITHFPLSPAPDLCPRKLWTLSSKESTIHPLQTAFTTTSQSVSIILPELKSHLKSLPISNLHLPSQSILKTGRSKIL